MWVSHKIFKKNYKKCGHTTKYGVTFYLSVGNPQNRQKNRGEEMTIEEKAQIVSKIFAALDIVPKEQKDQLTGIIVGYSMAQQLNSVKNGGN